jgi:murein DD-endopeptidase MepM/ murein hydrolase activator NlpD
MPIVTPRGGFGAHRAGPPEHAHQGVDLAARPGSRVLAVGDGVIVSTKPGLGKTVRKLRLDTPSAWSASGQPVEYVVYADLGRPLVEAGDHVRSGEPIALVDASGFIHFAVKTMGARGEAFIDPRLAGFAYRSTKGGAPWLV